MSENPKTTEHEHPITICLDFDVVCNTYSGWEGKDELFKPLPGLQKFLEELRVLGYEIKVHSTRGPEKLKAWFEKHALDHLIDYFPKAKPPAVAYVDDRAIRFDGDFNEVIDTLQIEGTEPWWYQDLAGFRVEGTGELLPANGGMCPVCETVKSSGHYCPNHGYRLVFPPWVNLEKVRVLAEEVKAPPTPYVKTCRVCGCTDLNCQECIEALGEPCTWVVEESTVGRPSIMPICSRCAAAHHTPEEHGSS